MTGAFPAWDRPIRSKLRNAASRDENEAIMIYRERLWPGSHYLFAEKQVLA
jgi:hypothetical protein